MAILSAVPTACQRVANDIRRTGEISFLFGWVNTFPVSSTECGNEMTL